jgi:dsDNA-binding SOS-regulon protein
MKTRTFAVAGPLFCAGFLVVVAGCCSVQRTPSDLSGSFEESDSRASEIRLMAISIDILSNALDERRRQALAIWPAERKRLLESMLRERRGNPIVVKHQLDALNAMQQYLTDLEEEQEVYSAIIVAD